MIVLFAAAFVLTTDARAAAIDAGKAALARFGVSNPGKSTIADHGPGTGWWLQYDRGNYSVFTVRLGDDLKLRQIDWSSTTAAYRPPRNTWQLKDPSAAKRRLDKLGAQIPGAYPVRWQDYRLDTPKPGKLAFRHYAFQQLLIDGHPVFSPQCGYSISISPLDGEIRSLWIQDKLPPIVAGSAKINTAQAQDLVRASVGRSTVARGWKETTLGYYLVPKETRARLIWRMVRVPPPEPLVSTKTAMYFVVDYVDAIEARYLVAPSRQDSTDHISSHFNRP